MAQWIYGRNTVKSALKEKKVTRIYLSNTAKEDEIVKECQRQHLRLNFVSPTELNQMVQGGSHQGVVAKISDYTFTSLETIIQDAKKATYPLLLVLDGLNDPHNLGAILRSADAFGAQGIIIGKHRQVGLTSTVAKVSTGAIDHVPVAQVTNLAQTIRYLKKEGFWIVASDGMAKDDYRKMDYRMPVVLIVGSEGEGISRLLMDQSDFRVKIPMCGSVNSLNASVATAVLLAQIYTNRFPL